MKSLINNNIFFKTILLVLVFIMCKSFITSGQEDVIVIYDEIKPSDSEFIIENLNVPKSYIGHKYFRKRVYKDSILEKIEHYDQEKSLISNLYNPALICYKYDTLKNLLKIRLFNENKEPYTDNFLGFSILELYYNENKKVKKTLAKDKDGKLICLYPAVMDAHPAIIKYKYMNDTIYIYKYNKNNKLIKKETVTKRPCIPYVTCGYYSKILKL